MRREQGHESLVCLKKIVAGQRGGIGPLETFKHQILQRGGTIDAGLKENQFKFRPGFAVTVPRPKKFAADRGLDPELFAKFARQGFAWRFARFDFSAREFPLQGMRIVMATLADKNPGVAKDQSRDDCKYRLT